MSERKKISSEDKEKARFVTTTARLSYPHLFRAQAMPGTQNKPKFSATLLLDKDDDQSAMKKAIVQAKKNFFGPDKDSWPKKIASPVNDGDDSEYAKNEGYAGNWVIKPSSNEDSKPAVVDKNGKEILEASKMYAGCYVKAACYAYVWEFPKGSGKFGVGFILDGVKFEKDGEPFSARKSAAEMFGLSAEEAEEEAEEDSENF